MPPWSSRFLGSSSNAHASHGSSRATPNHVDTDSDADDDDYYKPTLHPPHLQDPTNPFGVDLPAPNPPFHGHHGHSRSLSDKLPALFGGKKRAPADFEGASLPNDNHLHSHYGSPSVGKSARPVAGDDDGQDSGRCATCDGKVKWPRARTEYRCPTCLMINDLKVMPPRPGPQPAEWPGRPSPAQAPSRVHPISLDRTRALVNRCVNDYIQWRLRKQREPTERPGNERPGSSGREKSLPDAHYTRAHTPASSSSHISSTSVNPRDVGKYIASRGSHSLPAPHLPSQPRSRSIEPPNGSKLSRKPLPLVPPNSLPVRQGQKSPLLLSPATPSTPHQTRPRTAHAPTPRATTFQEASHTPSPFEDSERGPKAIFAPLEEYIVHHYGVFESVNVSFMKPRRRSRNETRRGASSGRPVPPLFGALAAQEQDSFSEIDAKTLLIGNIAENGLWWTGRGGKKDQGDHPGTHLAKPRQDRELGRNLTNSKSPQISFLELTQWYFAVIGAGRDWKYSIAAASDEAVDRIISQFDDAEVAQIDAAMATARAHVQRTLLKATENLLKRPGRPLREPSDVRFLLIILANPMLYPGAANSAPLREPAVSGNLKVPAGNGHSKTSDGQDQTDKAQGPLGPLEQGHASGVLKRTFGLLSNMPMEVQKAMVSWLARYDEQHFRSVVDLVGVFVTQRLRPRRGRKRSNSRSNLGDLIPNLSGSPGDASAELHAALGLSGQNKNSKGTADRYPAYSDDWQVRAASKVMAMLFAANKNFHGVRSPATIAADAAMSRPGSLSRTHIKNHGQLMSTTDFYNSLVDICDLILDFDTWEQAPSRFTFCQYPFFLSVGSKIKIMEHDARRQMEIKAREALFKSILRNVEVQSQLLLKVRRDCLVEDSLKSISEVVAQGQGEIKKGLKIQFVNEEGVDAGGLRKEWFLLLAREIFDPMHGMFIYDDESRFCYFNPYSFETSDQYFLVGALLGLAIYNTVILDVALPPFTFKKLLLSGHAPANKSSPFMRGPLQYTLEDLAEWQPRLARGLKQLLEYDGDVETTFCRDFVIEVERFGAIEQVPLCSDGATRAVNNQNRHEFVDLYIRYLLDKQVTRQFEPFKRGFFTVAGGNALSLFQPEEIELLIRGSDEPLDVSSLRAVATYENWPAEYKRPAEEIPLLRWFWDSVAAATPDAQRRLLGFITGSDRIPAAGATGLRIKICSGGPDFMRYPIARTCFNTLLLYAYRSRAELQDRLWTAVAGSEGFGLK